MIHIVKGFGIVNKAEIDVFLELSCFFDDPVDAGNLISGSSAFSKTTYNQLYCNKNFKKRKALYVTLKSRGGGREELPHAPTPEARGGGREDQPHVQGALTAQVQKDLEELSHVEGQEGWR